MTPDHTKQANVALSMASNRTMEVCKELNQARIKALAKQAGGTVYKDIAAIAFMPSELAEFVRLVREEVLEEAATACHCIALQRVGSALECTTAIRSLK